MARKPTNFAKRRGIVNRDRKRQAREEFLARGPERFTDIPKYLFQSSVERGKAQAVTGLLGQSLGSAVLQSRSARPGQRFKEFKSLVVDRTLGSMGVVGDVIRAKSRGRFDDNVTKGNADEKFEAIRNKFLGINDAVKVIDENFNKVNKRIEKLEKNAVELKNLNGLVKSVEDLDKKFDALDNKVDKQFSDFDTKFRLIMREMNQQSERVNVRGMTPRDQVVSGGGTGTGSGNILNQLLNSGTVARVGAASAAALAAARPAKLKAAIKALISVVARTAPGAARFGPIGAIGTLSVGLGPNETDILNDIKDLEKAIGKDSEFGVSDAITRMKQKVDFSTRNTADKNITQIQKAFENTNLPLMERGRLAIQNANQKFKKSSDPSYRKSAISSLMSDLNSLNITERQKQQLLNSVGPGIRNELDRMASRKKRANRRIISGKDYGTMGDDIDFGGGIPSSVGNMNLGAKSVSGTVPGSGNYMSQSSGSVTSTGQRIGVMPSLPMRNSSRGQLDFQSQFLRQQIEQQKSQFLKFGQLPPGFEFVQGNMGRLGSAQAVAARGAMPLMGMGSGGMRTPSYGGRAVSSGMGYGSSSPGYDTGSAQNFGMGSQDITIPTSGGKKGMIDRRQFSEELKNPRVKELFFTMMQAEVGSQGKKSQIAFAETVFNRATVEGKSLEGILSNRKYYQPYQNGAFNRARRSMNDSKRNSYAEILGIVQGGSDITKGATHNASAGVAASVKRGGYNSIRNSIIDIGGETYYRKTYEQKRFNARIKRFTEDQPQSGQQQGVNQQIPRTGVNVNQSQVGVYQPSQQSYARSGAGTINFKEGERHRGTVLHDAAYQTLEKQLEFQSGGLGNRSRLGYAAVITKDGRVVETANPGQLTYHTKGKTSSGVNVNRNFTSIGFIGGFSKEAIDRAVESGELARFFARRPGSLEQLTTHSQIVRGRGSHVHGGKDRERVGYYGGRGEATPQLDYLMKNHIETLRQQVEGYRSQRREDGQQPSQQAPVTSNISRQVTAQGTGPGTLAGVLKRGAQIGGVGPIRHKTFRGLCGKGSRGIVGALLNESYFRKGIGAGGSASAGSLSFNNNYLQSSGFYQDRQMVDKSKFTKEFMESLPIGTVVSSAAEKGRGHGHVQVKLANGKWASDALQNGVLLSGKYRKDGYAIHIPNAKGFEKLNPSIVGQHQPTLDAMQNIGVKVKPPTQQEQRTYQQEQQGPGMAGRETPLQFHSRLYGNIAQVSKTSGFSQNQLAAILGVPSTQKFEQYRARQAEEKRKQQLGRKALGQFTQAEINAARQTVPGPMGTRRPETDQEVKNRLTKAAINESAKLKIEDQTRTGFGAMDETIRTRIAGFDVMDANIRSAQLQSEQRAAAQRMMVPAVPDAALVQRMPFGRNAFAGEDAQIQLLERQRQAQISSIYRMDETIGQLQQAQMMDPTVSIPEEMANRVAAEEAAMMEASRVHPLAGMTGGQFKKYGDIGEAASSVPSTPQPRVNEFADFKEASKKTASNIGDIGDAMQEAEKAQNTKVMTGGLDDANVAQKASDAANEVKEKQAKGSTATSKSQKSSSGSGTGGSRGGSGGTNHPESEPASPGSGGYGSYGRCFV